MGKGEKREKVYMYCMCVCMYVRFTIVDLIALVIKHISISESSCSISFNDISAVSEYLHHILSLKKLIKFQEKEYHIRNIRQNPIL